MAQRKGRELNNKWNIGAKHALYRKTGDWYHILKLFPGTLIDAHGYVLFKSRRDLLDTPGISISKKKGKDWLSVRPGIASLRNLHKRVEPDLSLPRRPSEGSNAAEGVPLRRYDEAEFVAVQKSGTRRYRTRHKRITNALERIFAAMKPEQGRKKKKEYDVLLRNYDRSRRDLLIEVKPDPDKGSLRIAIGQLYDYRRSLRNAAATDPAVLTIGKPEQSYMELLSDLNITSLWFEDETCQKLHGAGTAWKSLHGASDVRMVSATTSTAPATAWSAPG